MKPFPLECNLNLFKLITEVKQGKKQHYSKHLGTGYKGAQIKCRIRCYSTQSIFRLPIVHKRLPRIWNGFQDVSACY